MRVDLIDYTGQGSFDPLYAARLLIYAKNTRLQGLSSRVEISMMNEEEVMADLAKIAMTLRSSWEFVDFTFQVSGVTRAFTHQMVRTRTASYAQQAMRVVDMSGFETLIPETVKNKGQEEYWTDVMTYINSVYKLLMEEGIPSQDARGVLPTNILTNILVKMNLRTFADLVGKRENLRAQGEYADVVRLMKGAALAVMPWLPPFLNPERTSTPALDKLMAKVLDGRAPASVPELNDVLKEIDLLKGTWG